MLLPPTTRAIAWPLGATALLLLHWGCQPNAPKAPAPLLDPEGVVRAYQGFYDQNAFAEAKALSTPAEQRRLDEMARLVATLGPDSTQLRTEITKINCIVKGDSATCDCQLRDQDGPYQARYNLVRQQGRWLMDAPRPVEEALPTEPSEFPGLDTLSN